MRALAIAATLLALPCVALAQTTPPAAPSAPAPADSTPPEQVKPAHPATHAAMHHRRTRHTVAHRPPAPAPTPASAPTPSAGRSATPNTDPEEPHPRGGSQVTAPALTQ
jgi:hypothetical protein